MLSVKEKLFIYYRDTIRRTKYINGCIISFRQKLMQKLKVQGSRGYTLHSGGCYEIPGNDVVRFIECPARVNTVLNRSQYRRQTEKKNTEFQSWKADLTMGTVPLGQILSKKKKLSTGLQRIVVQDPYGIGDTICRPIRIYFIISRLIQQICGTSVHRQGRHTTVDDGLRSPERIGGGESYDFNRETNICYRIL